MNDKKSRKRLFIIAIRQFSIVTYNVYRLLDKWNLDMNKILIGIIVVLLAGGGLYAYLQSNREFYKAPEEIQEDVHGGEEMMPVEGDGGIGDGGESLKDLLAAQGETQEVIGQSVEGRDIVAYHYGTGDREVLFVGGIHGGYSWNTALLAQQAIGYFSGNVEDSVPENVKVTIIPLVNPDGLRKVVDIDANESFKPSDIQASDAQKIAARFNENKVDLNRNFDCNWKETGVWKSQKVSGGSSPFSEPESRSIKSYIEKSNPEAVVVWYSSAGGVYASQCDGNTLAETSVLTNVYADASGYPAHKEFDSYEVNGDMVNWLAKMNIPAISVLLTDKQNTEWTKNKKGIEAVLNHIAL
jgi:hypothetical protein